jgi:exopolysaccharide biosynthesis polyprenyl glycosylphosphotransferase
MESEALQERKTVLRTGEREVRLSPVKRENYTALSDKQIAAKRVLDFVITLCAVPILLPLSLIIAVLIKLDSRGSLLFTQQRIGKSGEVFVLYKFRSMKIDAEKNGSKFASEGDNRITKLGNFIRTYRIDEIPQFWNVLKGEMSVIGPRPEQASFVEFFNEEIEHYTLRHAIKPGITGLAQVSQGYTSCKRTTKFKLDYDLFYIRNYSFQLDLNIVYKTIKTILTGFGSR